MVKWLHINKTTKPRAHKDGIICRTDIDPKKIEKGAFTMRVTISKMDVHYGYTSIVTHLMVLASIRNR